MKYIRYAIAIIVGFMYVGIRSIVLILVAEEALRGTDASVQRIVEKIAGVHN